MAAMPEIKLEPIDFGPTDDDRMKDLWVDVYKLEYANSRSEKCNGDTSVKCAVIAADAACKHFKQWLDVREVVVNDPVGDPKP